MPDAVWPPELTRGPRVDSFEETAPDLVARTQMDVGPAKVRARLTTNVRPINCSLDFTRAELAIFDEFFRDTCAGGAVVFVWANSRTTADHRYRFVGQPKYKPRGPRVSGEADSWNATFTLEDLGPADPGSGEGCPQVVVTDPEDVDRSFSTSSVCTLIFRIANLAEIGGLVLGGELGRSEEGGGGPGAGFTFADVRERTLTLPYHSSGEDFIKWKFPLDADDTDAAWVKFSHDDGFEFYIAQSEELLPEGSDDGYDAIYPEGAEGDADLVRHKGLPEIVEGGTGGADPAQLCSHNEAGPVASTFMVLTDATIDNACAPALAGRALGFRAYQAWCIEE